MAHCNIILPILIVRVMLYLWYVCYSIEADQDLSGGISTTQSALEMIKTSRGTEQ